ncbi:hypothetical protein C8R43DRAFT_1140753 [Mycena crocata]|nr:hypothetical protein C8R43DRAFT_1140753 [Mycena crocata]
MERNPDLLAQGLIKDGKALITPLVVPGSCKPRSRYPVLDSAPIAIVSLRLKGMPIVGDAGSILRDHLATYHITNLQDLVVIQMEYDLANAQAEYEKGIRAHYQVLRRVAKIIVLISSHSTPDTGDLHIEGGEKSAAVVEDVLQILVPEALRQIVKEAELSTMVILSCGAVHTLNTSRAAVGRMVKILEFQSLWGFTDADFHPQCAHKFLMDLTMQLFIHRHMASLPHLLDDHCNLGSQTSIVAYMPEGIFIYFWVQRLVRPNGTALPLQCPSCFALQSWKPTNAEGTPDGEELVFRCKGAKCTETWSATLPQGAFPLQSDRRKSSRTPSGRWYGYWVNTTGDVKTRPSFTDPSQDAGGKKRKSTMEVETEKSVGPSKPSQKQKLKKAYI